MQTPALATARRSVALVAVAFIAVALRRVRGRGEPEEPLAEEPTGSTWEAEVSSSIEAGPLESQDLGADLVEGEPSAAPEPPTAQPIPAWDRLAGPTGEPASGEAAQQDPRLREVDGRLQRLETRIEEVIAARDRLERQVSAQAEELRVLRAAIARAQRVLRSLARPEDATSESVPRDPNRGPPR